MQYQYSTRPIPRRRPSGKGRPIRPTHRQPGGPGEDVRPPPLQHHLEETGDEVPALYGLEAESISIQRLTTEIEQVALPLLGQSEDLLKLYELKGLDQSLRDLILFKVTHPNDTGEWNALQRKTTRLR